jgi:hypothetical protein
MTTMPAKARMLEGDGVIAHDLKRLPEGEGAFVPGPVAFLLDAGGAPVAGDPRP